MHFNTDNQNKLDDQYINIVDLTNDTTNESTSQERQKIDDNMHLLKNYTEDEFKFVKKSILTPKNLHKCWICLKNYNSNDSYMQQVKSSIPCGHYVCFICFKENKHKPCKQCLSIFDQTENKNENEIIVDSAEALASVEWLFDDIVNVSEVYMKVNYLHLQILSEYLKEKFNLRALKKTQLAAINAISMGKNVFVLMPSGGGKSLIYQLPACANKGITVVISPILSLINDQINTLTNNGIRAAHLTADSLEEISNQLLIENPAIRLLYMTPEKFTHSDTCKLLIQLYQLNLFQCIVFDEAHCITTWGKDFRYAYLSFKNILETCFKKVQIVLLTASATPQERRDIVQLLGLENRLEYFLYSFNRPNLQYEVEQISGIQAKHEKIATICKNEQFLNSTGIVYCISHADCENLVRYLSAKGIKAKSYHAGLSDNERLKIQREWTNSEHDKCRVIVATIAFGMGINKADVRFVLHNGLPKSLEGYYQGNYFL